MEADHKINQNEQKVQIQSRLDSVTEELEAFAYSVSHDLQGPVRHIRSFAKLIESRSAGTLDEKSALYLRNIITSAERMSQLINDLVAYSRVAKSDVRNIRFKLSDLVEEIISEDLMLETQGRKVEWEIEDLGEIRSDPILLRQMFTNLISNALKFTRPVSHPVITIGRINEKERTVIFIRDNGVGFDNKYADRAFDVFYRLHQEDKFEGSGIGLAIVRRIMTRCCGEVWAEGKINEGATIYLGFPNEIIEK